MNSILSLLFKKKTSKENPVVNQLNYYRERSFELEKENKNLKRQLTHEVGILNQLDNVSNETFQALSSDKHDLNSIR
ncbi:hypothetical protein D7X33_21640 [Butyricicoccus sp. 1XD8-22]|nr:hypothetical protein D7X33_21640 [Butyricicoccus sp. 1XD8-22]